MNSPFPNPPPEQHGARLIAAPGKVDWGLLGFLTSAIGTLLTAGILAPVGLLISLLALRRQRDWYPFVGCILGALGTAVFAALIYFAYLTYGSSHDPIAKEILDLAPLRIAQQRLERLRAQQHQQPTMDVGQRAIADLRDRWDGQVLYLPLKTGYILLAPGRDLEYLTDDDLIVVSSDADLGETPPEADAPSERE